MMDRPMTGWQIALRGISAALALTHGAAAQSGTSGAGTSGAGAAGAPAEGMCPTSAKSPECPERCPSFDTCRIDDGQDGRLYYRVNDQRFDCDGLDCRAASETLADYCCERGEFAPSSDGGGCSLAPGALVPSPGGDGEHGLWLGVLAVGIAGLRRVPWRVRPLRVR